MQSRNLHAYCISLHHFVTFCHFSPLPLAQANPLGALRLLFGKTGLMRGSAAAFFLVWFSNACINSQFGNYVNHLFGWGPQESAPLLVLVGVMLAIAPRVLVPRLGLKHSVEYAIAGPEPTCLLACSNLACGTLLAACFLPCSYVCSCHAHRSP